MVHGTNYSRSGNDDDVIGDYRPGSIQRVKLQNFLTHGNVEFKPGPRYVVFFRVVE
jgi:hypothetical protein